MTEWVYITQSSVRAIDWYSDTLIGLSSLESEAMHRMS